MRLIAIFLFLLSFNVMAETTTGVAFLRVESEEELEPKIRETVDLMKRGRFRGPGFNCNGRAKPYAIEVPGLRYRVDRHGNLDPFYLALVKYRCRS